MAMAVVSLAGLTSAGADERLSQGQTAPGAATIGGHFQTIFTARVPAHQPGIAGQIFLNEVNYPTVPPAPLQTTLSVYVQSGKHLRFLGDIDTAADGTFFIPLPPGIYILNPAPSTPYWWYSGQWPAIAVTPRQVAYDELDIVSNPMGMFP